MHGQPNIKRQQESLKYTWPRVAKLAGCLVILQALDVASTFLGLHLGAQEFNPLGVWLLDLGWWALPVAKAAGTLLIIGLSAWTYTVSPRLSRITLQWCLLLMVGVVSWNISTVSNRLIS